jgi:uncharacterized protein
LRYLAVIGRAEEVYCWRNHDWGEELANQFDVMERQGATHKVMLIESPNHARALELRIKARDDGAPCYVANFFDPNQDNHARIAKYHPRDFWNLDMQDMMHDPYRNYSAYHPEQHEEEPVSMVYVVTGNELHAPPPSRRRVALPSSLPLPRAHVCHWLEAGFAGNLEDDLEPVLSGLSDQRKRVDLLRAMSDQNFPGFYHALQNGHAEAVEVFCKLVLKYVYDPLDIVDLLSAWRPDRIPGFYAPMQEGHATTVTAFGTQVLNSALDPQQKMALLTAYGPGCPALYVCVLTGQAQTVGAFFDLVLGANEFNERQQVDLLLAKANTDADGRPCYDVALVLGDTVVTQTYSQRVLNSGLSPEAQVELLDARSASGKSALWHGASAGQADSVKVHCDALLQLPISDEHKMDLLVGAPDGEPAPYQVAMDNGHVQTAAHIARAIRSLAIAEERKEAALKR